MLKNIEIVRQVDNHQLKKIFHWCCLLGAFFLLVVLYLRQPIKKTEIEKEINCLNSYLVELEDTNLKLIIEKQSLLAFPKVKERADLLTPGFQKPEEGQLLRVRILNSGCKIH
ncbi:MAG: hypothetical protein ACMUJM_07105 [bacterium]